jgi:hypothetical protein
MSFIMVQIIDGLAEYAFAMHPELRYPPSGLEKRDFSDKEPAKNSAGLSHRSVPSKITSSLRFVPSGGFALGEPKASSENSEEEYKPVRRIT